MRSILAISIPLLAAVAFSTHASTQGRGNATQEQQVLPPEARYWMGVTTMSGMTAMAGMAQGKAPYDAKDFAKRAERVATMAPMLLEGYPPGSGSGAPTRAKPEIWDNFDEFSRLMHAMEDKAAALAEVAKEGNLEKSRAAVGELGDACKACHDKYRAKAPGQS